MDPSIPQTQQFIDTTLMDAGMSVSLTNRLRRNSIHTLGSASLYTEVELLMLDRIGPQTVDLIKTYLDDHGLSLRLDDEPLLEKAKRLYPDAKLMPLNVLLRSVELGYVSTTHLKLRFQTLGDLSLWKPDEVAQLLRSSDYPYWTKSIKEQERDIKTFIKRVGLSFA